ncbi:MAG: response regulator [Desulfamplus sp.]|nr:response regulator [Desulfamplus sp.]
MEKFKKLMKNSEKNILLVDDNPINIQLLGKTLQNEGYAISFAINGKQAIELATESAFDLILLDIMMPGKDGFEVLETLKQRLIDKVAPVIFLTAKTENESILKAFSLGAVDYIIKPFQSSEVLARVRTQLELAESRSVLIQMNQELFEINKKQAQTNQQLLEEIALRKQNEDKLRDSEAIYRRLVENVPAIVYSFSKEKGRTFVSPKVKEILGYKVDDFHKNPFLWRECVHPEDRERYLKALSNSLSADGSDYDIKYRIKGAAGEWHWFLDRSFGMHVKSENGIQLVEGIAIDITEQQTMERELLKLAKLESAGVFAGGIAHDMNNLNFIVSGNIELAREDLTHEVSTHVHKHLDSTLNYLEDAFQAVQKQTGLIRQFVTFTEGFQPHKQDNNIELLIHETTRILGEKLQSKVQVSIEDNLWSVKFDKSLMMRAVEGILINADESMPNPGIIKIVVRNSDAIQELNNSDAIQELNNSDAIQELNNRDAIQEFNNRDAIQEFNNSDAIQELNNRDAIQEFNNRDAIQEFNGFKISDELPVVEPVSDFNSQQFPNLFAGSFSGKGKYVVISIIDQGIGISENELGLIFDPYYSKKDRGTQKGMGLGLTMVLAMVKKHGGDIFVSSKVGKGSVFSIYLPSEQK